MLRDLVSERRGDVRKGIGVPVGMQVKMPLHLLFWHAFVPDTYACPGKKRRMLRLWDQFAA